MRTVSTAQQTILEGGLRGQHLKVEIKDAGGTWRDMASYPGFDSVRGASWRESLDGGIASAEISFIRELDGLSLAPLIDSGPNKGFVPTASTVALIAINREIRLSVASIPGDNAATSGQFEVFFHGKIDGFDVADNPMTVTAKDLAGQLVETYIEAERHYAIAAVSGAPVGVRVFEPGQAYVLNEYVMPTEGNRLISGAARFYKVTTAGTAAVSEPSWPASGTVSSNTVVFTYQGTLSATTGYAVEAVMQQILNDNGFSSFTLSTPTSPSWNITAYRQERTSVFDALRTLALQIGWDLRMKWNSTASEFRLTFYDPNRSKTSPDFTFTQDMYEAVTGAAIDSADIRNVVRVIFLNAATTTPDGIVPRDFVEVSDANSITKYGRRYFEIAEDATSNIDSSSEATTLANAALSDLKEPTLSHEVVLAYAFPWAELNDLFRFNTNGRHYSSNQDLACVAIQHDAFEGELKTTLSCRGKPTAGARIWAGMNRPLPDLIKPKTPITFGISTTGMAITSTPIPGGARFKMGFTPLLRAKPVFYELHVSSATITTPDSSTLVTRTDAREVELTKLNPGTTYYVRFIPIFRDGEREARGLISTETTFVAGRTVSHHLESEIAYSQAPLNRHMESRFGGAAGKDNLPDHWELVSGTLGTEVSSKYDDTAGVGNARSGLYYLRFATTSSTGAVKTKPMVLTGGQRYKVTTLAKNISGTGNWSQTARLLKYDKTALSSEQFSHAVTEEVGTWFDRTNYLNAGANARYMQLEVGTGSSSTQSFDVDSVRIEEVPDIARYYHTAGASIPNATSTIINFDTAFDSQTNSNVTTGASWAYAAPRRGYYLIQTAVTIVYANNDSGTCYIEVFKNGSVERRIWRQSGHVLREETQYMASCILYLNRGDDIDIRIYQSTGHARNLEGGTQTYVEIMQVA